MRRSGRAVVVVLAGVLATAGASSGLTVRNGSGSSRGRFDGCRPGDRRWMAAVLFFFMPLHNH